MVSRKQAIVEAREESCEVSTNNHPAASLAIAQEGIETSSDFRNMMSALMSDVIRGALSPEVTNAACNAGGKLLKMVELEHKYASMKPERRNATMLMAGSK